MIVLGMSCADMIKEHKKDEEIIDEKLMEILNNNKYKIKENMQRMDIMTNGKIISRSGTQKRRYN